MVETEITGKNIIEHLKLISKLREQTSWYYYYSKSKLWKAVQNHINNSEECLLINREGRTTRNTSCDGVHFKDVFIYTGYKNNKPYEEIVYNFYVSYVVENSGSEDTYEKNYTLYFPVDLELNFTNKKFNSFLNNIKKNKVKEEEKEVVANFKALLKKLDIDISNIDNIDNIDDVKDFLAKIKPAKIE